MRQVRRTKEFPYINETDILTNSVTLQIEYKDYTGKYLGQKKTKKDIERAEKLINIFLGFHK